MPPDRPENNEKREEKKEVFAEEKMTNQELAARIRDLENTLAATRAGAPLSLVPENAGGEGTEIAPTWSYAEQMAATEASRKK